MGSWKYIGVAVLICLSVSAQAIQQCPRCAQTIEMSAAAWQCLVEEARQKQNASDSPVFLVVQPKQCRTTKAPGRRLPKVDPNLKADLTILTLAHVRCIAERGGKVRPGAQRKVVVDLAKLCA